MGRAIASPQADSIQILAAVLSVLSPEPPTPDSTQASLVHSVLPLPEPKVSGYK